MHRDVPALTFGDVLLLTHPLGQLRVHHEVVDVLLRPGQLQLPGDHRHQESRAARTLQRERVENVRETVRETVRVETQ